MRRNLEDHRRHRTSLRDRQDPHPPRLARPSTTPSSGQGLRSIPTGLIPLRSPIPSGSAPEPTLPVGPRSPETPKPSETSRLGPRKGPKMPRSRPRTRMLDSSRAQHYSTSWRKRAFEIPIRGNYADYEDRSQGSVRRRRAGAQAESVRRRRFKGPVQERRRRCRDDDDPGVRSSVAVLRPATRGRARQLDPARQRPTPHGHLHRSGQVEGGDLVDSVGSAKGASRRASIQQRQSRNGGDRRRFGAPGSPLSLRATGSILCNDYIPTDTSLYPLDWTYSVLPTAFHYAPPRS